MQLLLFLLISICFIAFIFQFQKKRKQNKGRKIHSKGLRAEEKALLTLKSQGFKLLDRNPSTSNHIFISNEKRMIQATPDLLMKRGRQKWIFEIKSQNAANIHKADVRRQLREYAALFPNYKLAFFDANLQRWDEVTFPEFTSKYSKFKVFLCLILGLVMGIFLDRYFFSDFF
jgi:hypothetical protein